MDLLLNPSNDKLHSSKSHRRISFPLKPCHVGIHWIAVAEYSQMSAKVPGL